MSQLALTREEMEIVRAGQEIAEACSKISSAAVKLSHKRYRKIPLIADTAVRLGALRIALGEIGDELRIGGTESLPESMR